MPSAPHAEPCPTALTSFQPQIPKLLLCELSLLLNCGCWEKFYYKPQIKQEMKQVFSVPSARHDLPCCSVAWKENWGGGEEEKKDVILR